MRKQHGGCGTLTYSRWKSMMQRCNDQKCGNYKYYGARGVKVCDRWQDFANFREDMGECPDRSMTLDRIENHRGYEPGNCRWVTQAAQNKNRTHCVLLEHNGVTKNVADWATEIGMTANSLSMLLRLGWSVEKALTTPLKSSPKPKKAA